VFLFAILQLIIEAFALYMTQDIFNGFNAHFGTCVTFPQQLDSILFDHIHPPFHRNSMSCFPGISSGFCVKNIAKTGILFFGGE
jgi:hypothetical protein